MLDEFEGLDAAAQEAQFAELVAANAYAPKEDASPDPALNKGSVAEWAEWAAGNGLLEPGAPKLAGAFEPNIVRNCATGAEG